MKKMKIGLMGKFVIFSSLTLLIIVLVIAVSTILSIKAAAEQAEHNLDDLVISYAEIVDEYLQNKSAYVIGLSKNSNVTNYFKNPQKNNQSIAYFLEEEFNAANGVYENMFLASYETSKIVVDGKNGESVGIDLTPYPFFEGTQKQDIFIDPVIYRSPVTDRMVFVIAAPVFDENGKRVGLIATPIEWEVFLERRINNYKVGETGYAFMLDMDGQLVAHPDNAMLLTSIYDYDFGEAFMSIKNGNLKYVYKGKTKYASFREIKRSGWKVASSVYQKELISGTIRAAITSIIVGAILFSVLAAIFILFVKVIVGNVQKLTWNSKEIADGNLNVYTDIKSNDELGNLGRTFNRMIDTLLYKGKLLEQIAGGDLSINIKLASERDGLGKSLQLMKDSLNKTLAQVNNSVEQVASGAQQVALSSQSLSQGATEQASSLEEISSSITEISGQVQSNTENAQEANKLSKTSLQSAEGGNVQMKNLVTAMERINSSSGEIKKVIKTIDDIAFQINLLALNANVEAARAGKYGKGFAVVADEVRNLAVRSANAVKETTLMVEESIVNINNGNILVEKTASQLELIAFGSKKVATLVEEITSASKEQSEGLNQISSGLGQVDQVTQSNTAGAEQSASAAEELAAMAVQLKQMVSLFKLESGSSVDIPGIEKNKREVIVNTIDKADKKIEETDKVALKTVVNETIIDPRKVIALDDTDFSGF